MSDLSRARIYFDKVSVSGLRLQHEIESMHAGEIETAGHLFSRGGHFRVLYHAQDRGVPGRAHFVDHFEMEISQHFAIPTSDGAVCFAPRNKRLRIYNRATTKQ